MIVYYLRAAEFPIVKIGQTTDFRTLEERICSIQSPLSFETYLAAIIKDGDEKGEHLLWERWHKRAEWFYWVFDMEERLFELLDEGEAIMYETDDIYWDQWSRAVYCTPLFSGIR